MPAKSTPKADTSRAATAKATDRGQQIKEQIIGLGAGLLVLGGLATAAFGESHEAVTITHAYSNFGTVKYDDPNFPHLDYVNPDAPKGGYISVSSQSNFDSFNPFTRKGVAEFTAASLMLEDILTSTADDPYGLYCYLCTTMEYPESRDWVIFNLREDVRFQDGTPMTAEDLEFGFNLIMEQGISEYRSIVSQFIAGVEVLGPHRIKYLFTEDAPRRDVIGFAGGTNAFSKAWFEETGARLDESQPVPFMGTGPYVLGDVDMGRSVTYVKDEDWWGVDHPLNVGRWNFDEISVEVFADASAAMEGFKAGEYTFRNENSSKEWATSYDFPAVQDGLVKVEELPDGTIGSAQGFVFNLREPEWQDVRVRDAINMMLNFEWMNETLFFGLYERPVSFWQNSDLMARGVPDADEIAILQPLVDEGLLPASILTDEAVGAFSNDGDENLPDRRTRRAALALLEDAGWVAGDDGMVRNADGQTLELVILQTSPAFDRIVNPYVENLRSIGIDARLERVDLAQYTERRRAADWDMINHTLTQGYEPGTGLRQWFDSATAADSSRNIMALQNPAVDRLLDVAIAAETLDEVQLAARVLDRVLRAERFWIPQWFKDVHTIAYWDQYRYPEPLPPLALGTLDFWWFDAEAAQRLKDAGAL